QSRGRTVHETMAAEAGADEETIDGQTTENGLIIRRHLVQPGPLSGELRVSQQRESFDRLPQVVQSPLLVDPRVEAGRLVAVRHSGQNSDALSVKVERAGEIDHEREVGS